jgi:hypothetical protein
MLPEDYNDYPIGDRPTRYIPPLGWRYGLICRPLATADSPNQTMGKLIGSAVFSSDAFFSIAYGPREVLFILVLAGIGAYSNAFPIAHAIIMLLAILQLSYKQNIHSYPDGGGAYIVARDNVGKLSALVAGAT